MSITEDRVVSGRTGRATLGAAERIAAFAKATEAYAESLDDPDLANVYWGKSLGLRQAVAILAAECEAPPAKPAVHFAQSLRHLSRWSVEHRAAELTARRNSPGDDVAWWEATTALNRAIRRHGIGHQAAMAAHLASQALLAAASRTGLALSPEVTALARSAGEVGRLLVVRDLNTSAAGYLTRGWDDLLPPALPPGPFDAAGGRGKASGRACLHRSNLGNESRD